MIKLNGLIGCQLVETAPSCARVCRFGCIDGNLVAATCGGNLLLSETAGYDFVFAGCSGCRVKGKAIFSCQQVPARLIVADLKLKSFEEHHVFDFRAWDIFLKSQDCTAC